MIKIYCCVCYRHIGISSWTGVKDIQFFCAVCQEQFDELPSCEEECCKEMIA